MHFSAVWRTPARLLSRLCRSPKFELASQHRRCSTGTRRPRAVKSRSARFSRFLPIRDYGLPEGQALTGRSTLFGVPTRRLARPFLRRPCAAGRPSAAFDLFRRQSWGPPRTRLSPFFAYFLPIPDYGLPEGRALTGRSTLFSARALQSRPLSFSFSTPCDTVAFISLHAVCRRPRFQVARGHRPFLARLPPISAFSEQEKVISRNAIAIVFFQDTKRPFRAILSSIFALFKTQKTTTRPFRARI